MAINRDKVYDGAIKLLEAKKFDKAIEELKKLLVDDANDVRTLLKIAETLHVKMGKRKEALEHYDKAATIYTNQGFFLKAVAVFKQMLTVDATNPEMHKKLAELYQQLGYGSQCLLHYQQVVVLYEQQGRGDETLDILKRMVDLDPENLQSRIKVAELFAQQNRVAEAATEMRSAFDYLKGQQRFDDALRVGEKVLVWDPNALEVARELAGIYMERRDAKQALAKLQMCFRVDPRNLEILKLIADAFLALDQTPKTISVYKEMARIHEGNSDVDQAKSCWERVLELQPGDDDAEIALGRRAATVVATPGSAAGISPVAATQAAPPRVNPEEEQLQRLLTETDVYVKYGLRDKAVEHLDKIFAIRPDHLPGLEKLKQLQTQLKQPTTETLKRLIAKGEELGHPKLAEWKAELARAPAAKAAPPPKQATLPAQKRPPASSMSSEGEVILVEEEAPPPNIPKPQPPAPAKKPPPVIRGGTPRQVEPEVDAPTMLQARPSAAPQNLMASMPSSQAAPGDDWGSSKKPLPPDLDEPLEDVRTVQRGGAPPMASPLESDEPLGMGVPTNGAGFPAMSAGGRPLPPDEDLDAPTMALQIPMSRPTRPPPEVPRPATMGLPPVQLAQARELVLEEALEADADALVREALADIPQQNGANSDEVLADELVLQQEDEAPPPFAAPAFAPPPVPASTTPDDGYDEIDALAAAAVKEALPPQAQKDEGFASTAIMALSDDEMGELQKFVEKAAQPGASAPPSQPLPPEFDSGPGDEDEFNDRTVAYPGPMAGGQNLATAPLPPDGDVDEDAIETGERKVLPRTLSPAPVSAAFDKVAASIPEEAFAPPAAAPAAGKGEAPIGTSEFNPDEFDLPDDVKALLSQRSADAPPPFDDFSGVPDNDALTGAIPKAETGRFESSAIGSIPSLASMDADAVVDLDAPPPMGAAPVADVDDAGMDLPSQSRSLFAPQKGFEDDPANTFFPDELAEAEFFIQQELLDEAREILEPILEEVDDSLRVQHMLARVKAKENGEPEPPAPWEQKLIDEVAAELDDIAALAPPPNLPSMPEQVSVEEVLSQFKKGIAETVPEDDAATHYDLGIAYREMGLLDEAVGEFEISSRAASKSADSWYLVGLVRADQGRADDALAAFEKAYFSATATKEQRAAAEHQRGVVLEGKKQGKEALVCFKRAKQLGGTAPDLDRRIAALAKVHGDVEVPELDSKKNGSVNGNGTHKPAPATGPGRPKNIDYV